MNRGKVLIIAIVMYIIGAASAWQPACAFDLRNLGDIEGLGKVGEVIRTVDKSIVVLGGGTSSSRGTAARVNRGVGHAKSTAEKVRQGNTTVRDIPYLLQDVQDLTRYIER